MGAALHRSLAEGAGAGGGRQCRAADSGNAARWGRQSLAGESVPALRVRHVDGADLSAHSVRAIRDDIICHCKSAEEARALWGALADRFAVCKLVLHPQKTKTVYCKDANRRGDFPSQSFDFLGLIPSEEDAMARTHPHARFPARSSTTSADVHQPGDPALGTSPSQRQVPARYGSMA